MSQLPTYFFENNLVIYILKNYGTSNLLINVRFENVYKNGKFTYLNLPYSYAYGLFINNLNTDILVYDFDIISEYNLIKHHNHLISKLDYKEYNIFNTSPGHYHIYYRLKNKQDISPLIREYNYGCKNFNKIRQQRRHTIIRISPKFDTSLRHFDLIEYKINNNKLDIINNEKENNLIDIDLR